MGLLFLILPMICCHQPFVVRRESGRCETYPYHRPLRLVLYGMVKPQQDTTKRNNPKYEETQNNQAISYSTYPSFEELNLKLALPVRLPNLPAFTSISIFLTTGNPIHFLQHGLKRQFHQQRSIQERTHFALFTLTCPLETNRGIR